MKDAKDRAGRAVAAPSVLGQVPSTDSPACRPALPMQPPQMRPWLLQQLEQLKEQAARQAQVTPPSPRAPTNQCTNVDYKQLIQRWFTNEPPALRDRKYSMTEFVIRFAGRFRPKPATRLIAEALRELGWTEHRDWTRAGRNRRYWQPPVNLTLANESAGTSHPSGQIQTQPL